MKSGILRFIAPGAAVLLFAGVLAPLPSAAQADPTATPAAGTAVTGTVTSTLKATGTVTETGTITATGAPKAGDQTATVKTSAGEAARPQRARF